MIPQVVADQEIMLGISETGLRQKAAHTPFFSGSLLAGRTSPSLRWCRDRSW